MNLIVHPDTSNALRSIAAHLPQSLLLTGEVGVGLETIARSLSKHILGILQPLNAKAEHDDEAGLISIEMVRRLYDQTRAKHIVDQVVIIDDADRMSNGAQAAFLKLLEEPNSHIHFILTSHNPQRILPTIHSRVEHCHILPISIQQTTDFIQQLNVQDKTKQAQLAFIGQGLPAELIRLAKNDVYFSKRAGQMGDARNFLQSSSYDKALIIQKYKNSRADSLNLIDSALQILKRSISSRPQRSIIIQLELLLDIRENLLMNFNVGLQLTRFML